MSNANSRALYHQKDIQMSQRSHYQYQLSDLIDLCNGMPYLQKEGLELLHRRYGRDVQLMGGEP